MVYLLEEVEKVDELWQRYKQTNDKELRDQLVVQYTPLVEYVATKVGYGLPNHIERADLISYGFIGLINAIERYDPTRQVKFETYAISRIKGAIIDELRALDWVPRSVRSRLKEVEQTYTNLQFLFHRPPTDAELAQELQIGRNELAEIFRQMSFAGITSLDEAMFPKGRHPEALTLKDSLIDLNNEPQTVVETQEVNKLLYQILLELDEKERTVLVLYYYKGFTFAQIGEMFGVTESRMCQIHTKAISRLKAKWKDLFRSSHRARSKSHP